MQRHAELSPLRQTALQCLFRVLRHVPLQRSGKGSADAYRILGFLEPGLVAELHALILAQCPENKDLLRAMKRRLRAMDAKERFMGA